MSKNRTTLILLLVIIIIGAALRLYNAPYRYALGEETVRDAVVGIEGARELQAPLTGAFSSLGPFTFGPLYGYQLIVASLLIPTLYAPWIYMTMLSIAYIFVIYKIGRILIDSSFGLIVAFIAAVSPAQIISATHLTSHNMTNIFAVLAIWLFLKLLSKKESMWWNFWLGITIGIGMNLHFQMSGLLVLPILLFVTKPKDFVRFLLSLFGVFVTFLPLLFFELNNHWFNVRNMIDYLRFGRTRIYVANRWLFYIRDFWPGFWADALGTPIPFTIAIIIGSTLSFLLSMVKKSLSKKFIFLFLAFSTNFIILRYYWGPRFYGYLNFLRPFVFLFTAYFLWRLTKFRSGILVALLLLLTIVYFAWPRIVMESAPDAFSAMLYGEVAKAEKQLGNKGYTVYGCTKAYHTQYNAETFTIAFISELHHKASTSGAKVGLMSKDCQYPRADTGVDLDVFYSKLNNIGLVDFSKSTDSYIKEAGWEPVTFRSIYDGTARWWLKNDL